MVSDHLTTSNRNFRFKLPVDRKPPLVAPQNGQIEPHYQPKRSGALWLSLALTLMRLTASGQLKFPSFPLEKKTSHVRQATIVHLTMLPL